MGTRARIALQIGKTYLSIYTHWDGYPDHHGPILLDHYNTEAKIRELFKLGDLSSLRENIGEKHNPYARLKEAEKWCAAYARDYGEKNVSAKRSMTLGDLEKLAEANNAEYVYLFSANVWTVNDHDNTKIWKDLALETIKAKLTS